MILPATNNIVNLGRHHILTGIHVVDTASLKSAEVQNGHSLDFQSHPFVKLVYLAPPTVSICDLATR